MVAWADGAMVTVDEPRADPAQRLEDALRENEQLRGLPGLQRAAVHAQCERAYDDLYACEDPECGCAFTVFAEDE